MNTARYLVDQSVWGEFSVSGAQLTGAAICANVVYGDVFMVIIATLSSENNSEEIWSISVIVREESFRANLSLKDLLVKCSKQNRHSRSLLKVLTKPKLCHLTIALTLASVTFAFAVPAKALSGRPKCKKRQLTQTVAPKLFEAESNK